MYRLITPVAVLAVTIGLAGSAFGQNEKPLAVPGFGVAKDVPNAHTLPDPNTVYKVLFDVSKAPAKPDQINPTLDALARYLNTLDKWGVPADHRKLAVIFHQGGAQAYLTDEMYKEKNGVNNPNIALIKALKKAGVEFHACGQGVVGRNLDRKYILPEVEVDLWALVSIVDFQMRGYARIGN
jgi:intracellular sulfur oxidation DsrE/DsrF family protein